MSCLRFDPNPFKNTFCRACYKKKDKHQRTDVSPPEVRINASDTTEEPCIVHSTSDNKQDKPNANHELRMLTAKINNLDVNQIEELSTHTPSPSTSTFSNIHIEQQFAALPTYSKCQCNGHICVICKRCRDWCTKSAADWVRIRDIILSGNVTRWNSERAWLLFERRVDATCMYDSYYPDRRNNLDFDGHCLCMDNCKVYEEK